MSTAVIARSVENQRLRQAALNQRPQDVSGISPVGLLFTHITGSNLCHISKPYFVTKALHHVQKPLAIARGFNTYQCRPW